MSIHALIWRESYLDALLGIPYLLDRDAFFYTRENKYHLSKGGGTYFIKEQRKGSRKFGQATNEPTIQTHNNGLYSDTKFFNETTSRPTALASIHTLNPLMSQLPYAYQWALWKPYPFHMLKILNQSV